MSDQNGYIAGFAWRRAQKRDTGGWLRDLALALAIAVLAGMLCTISDAHAQQLVIKVGGGHRTAMVRVPIGQSQDVRTDNGFVDIMVSNPDVADVNPLTDHSLSILAKKIGTTRVSVYAEGKKLIGIFDVEVTAAALWGVLRLAPAPPPVMW